MSIDDKRKQVRKQAQAVAYMARILATMHEEYNTFILDNIQAEDLLEAIGVDTHERMQTLGDMINEMDAVLKKDEATLNPVFAKAREMFPFDN
jgi:hypothetical protein